MDKITPVFDNLWKVPPCGRKELEMERFALDALRAWKNRRGRKPLVMRGARQVGKTWLVRKRAAPFSGKTRRTASSII